MRSERNGHPGGNGHAAAGRPAATPDRLPPQNIEAEQSVLGSILLDNSVLDDIAPFLAAADFYRETLQTAYGVVMDLYRKGVQVDVISLGDELERRGLLKRVGGDEFLARLVDSVPHALNAKYHAQIVKQKSVSRQLIEAGNAMVHACYLGDRTAEEQVEEAERLVFAVADGSTTDCTVAAHRAAAEAVARVMSRGTGLIGISTGLAGLDGWTDGLHPEQMVILAARPSMGKTALALNVAQHVGVKHKRGVLFVSLEMGEVELGERLICQMSMVPNNRLRYWSSLRADEIEGVNMAMARLETAPLHLDVAPARTMLQVLANARRLKARGDLALVVVDYLQLVTPDESRGANRTEAVAQISRDLKKMARELKVPVIALSQLNRAVENREDKRPRMADLRESGAIEQDADVVLMLHRPDYYDEADKPGEAELLVVKNRNGPTGTIPLSFIKEVGRFGDLAPPIPPAETRPAAPY